MRVVQAGKPGMLGYGEIGRCSLDSSHSSKKTGDGRCQRFLQAEDNASRPPRRSLYDRGSALDTVASDPRPEPHVADITLVRDYGGRTGRRVAAVVRVMR